MPHTVTAQVNDSLPGAVTLSVVGDAGVQSWLYRIDGSLPAQPVRNYSTTGSGLVQVVDCEAPLGRPVTYNLTDATAGLLLAVSNEVICPAPADSRSVIRSVLKPTVAWLWVEPQDEAGVDWTSSTRAYEIVGSDTPVIVGEIRQRRSGTVSFLCKSIDDADDLVALLRDGTPVLLRNSPCAGVGLRDVLFYALDVREVIVGKNTGWRTVLVDYQSTAFVAGDTETPPIGGGWDFAGLAASASTFAALTAKYANFASMTLNQPKAAGRAAEEAGRV